MKTGVIVTCLALLPLTAQNSSEIKHLTVGPVVSGGAVVPKIHLAAKSIEQSAGIVYLKGSVEINLGMYALLADEAEYFPDSGEIQAPGKLRLKPTPILDPRGVSQFGVK